MSFKYSLLALLVAICCSCDKEDPIVPYPFTEFSWGANVNSALLCTDAPADPADTTAVIQLACMIEGDSFATSAMPPKNELLLFAYNIERGHHGQEIIDLLMSKSELEIPDIIMLSEVDRNCANSFGGLNFARVLADSLDMYYVYGTEFYEVGGDCEIGNAILSKYPLGNVEYHRFAAGSTYYLYTDSGINYRQGGRSFVSADVKVGEQYVRVYSTHLAAFVLDQDIRESQAQQIADHVGDFGGPAVIAGDFNSYKYSFQFQTGSDDLGLAKAFLDLGFEDTHTSLPFNDRITNVDILDLVIDLFFVRNATYSNPGVGNYPVWDGLSDHAPVWTTITIE